MSSNVINNTVKYTFYTVCASAAIGAAWTFRKISDLPNKSDCVCSVVKKSYNCLFDNSCKTYFDLSAKSCKYTARLFGRNEVITMGCSLIALVTLGIIAYKRGHFVRSEKEKLEAEIKDVEDLSKVKNPPNVSKLIAQFSHQDLIEIGKRIHREKNIVCRFVNSIWHVYDRSYYEFLGNHAVLTSPINASQHYYTYLSSTKGLTPKEKNTTEIINKYIALKTQFFKTHSQGQILTLEIRSKMAVSYLTEEDIEAIGNSGQTRQKEAVRCFSPQSPSQAGKEIIESDRLMAYLLYLKSKRKIYS